MKIRTLIAAAMSVALLTVFVAAPVSAGGPATYKVGSRGVAYSVGAWATNCPDGAVGAERTQPAARNAVDAALKSKLAARTESASAVVTTLYPCGPNVFVPREDPINYYDVWALTTEWVYAQAGSGYEFTGVGVSGPVTHIVWTAWIWSDHFDAWVMHGDDEYLDADISGVAADLAWGGSVTYIPGIGDMVVACVARGAWIRGAVVETGTWGPGDGWTYETGLRSRFCYGEVVVAGELLQSVTSMWVQRAVFTTVDVYPYPW